MKQLIKKLFLFLILMSLFTSSQEKTCINIDKCMVAAEPVEVAASDSKTEDLDSDMILMPISRFIIMQ